MLMLMCLLGPLLKATGFGFVASVQLNSTRTHEQVWCPIPDAFVAGLRVYGLVFRVSAVPKF